MSGGGWGEVHCLSILVSSRWLLLLLVFRVWRVWWCLLYLVCISLVVNEVEYPFMCLSSVYTFKGLFLFFEFFYWCWELKPLGLSYAKQMVTLYSKLSLPPTVCVCVWDFLMRVLGLFYYLCYYFMKLRLVWRLPSSYPSLLSIGITFLYPSPFIILVIYLVIKPHWHTTS